MSRRTLYLAAALALAGASLSCARPVGRTRSPLPPEQAPRREREASREVTGTRRAGAKLPPVILYSPHPDDESIAMAQAIRRWVKSGRRVYAVLLTDGEDSRSYDAYYVKHPEIWRDYNGDGRAGDRADFGLSRRQEFIRATGDLGIPRDHLAFYGAAGRETRDALRRDFFPRDRVQAIMRSYEKRFPGALHVTVMKYTDGALAGPGDFLPQQEHTATCEALRALVDSDHLRAMFYKVYVYDVPAARRWAPHVEDDPGNHPEKVEALEDGYDRAGSTPDHLGIGWASVPVAIRNDLADTREYRTDAADFR